MKTIDLFAGVGGVRLAFEKHGFETVFANDLEPACKETYDMNFDTCKLMVEDINNVKISELPSFDILLAGFPCQPFSIAGYRKGFEDKGRGDLFFTIAKIIKAKKPKAIFLENVKNLKSHNQGKTLNLILQELNKMGYHVHHAVLNSMTHANIPQNRERVFIVAFDNKDTFDKFKFPSEMNLTKSFKELLEINVDERFYYNDKPLYEKLVNNVDSENRVYQWRRKYVRENKNGVVPTLTANMGTGGHNVPIVKDKKGIRKLTPKECFLMQGFPKSFKLPELADSKLYKQAGNSVTVELVEKVAKEIKIALESS